MYLFADSPNAELAKTVISVVALIVSAAAFWDSRKSRQTAEKWKQAEQRIDTAEELGKADFLVVQYQINLERMLDQRERYSRKLAAVREQARSAEEKKRVESLYDPASDASVWTEALEQARQSKKTLEDMWSLPKSSTDLNLGVRKLSARVAEQSTKLQNLKARMDEIAESRAA